MPAVLDDADLGLGERARAVAEVTHRKHTVFATPGDQHRAAIRGGATEPGLADRRAHAAEADAGGERADELRKRRVAVACRLLDELGRDAPRVVEARREDVSGRGPRARHSGEETEPWDRARTQEERDVPSEAAGRHEHQRACALRRAHRGHEGDRSTHGLPGDVCTAHAEGVHRRQDEARIEGLLGPEVPDPSGSVTLAESRKIERDHAAPRVGKRPHHRAPGLRPCADPVDQHEADQEADRDGQADDHALADSERGDDDHHHQQAGREDAALEHDQGAADELGVVVGVVDRFSAGGGHRFPAPGRVVGVRDGAGRSCKAFDPAEGIAADRVFAAGAVADVRQLVGVVVFVADRAFGRVFHRRSGVGGNS